MSTDGDFSKIYVQNLATPIGSYPNVLIRTTDVLYIEVDV